MNIYHNISSVVRYCNFSEPKKDIPANAISWAVAKIHLGVSNPHVSVSTGILKCIYE